MLRTVLAAIAGYALIGVLVVFTDQLFSLMIQGFRAMATLPDYYFKVTLGTDAFYSILGGYLCAALAQKAAKDARLWMIVGGEMVGLAAVIALWKTQPHWFALGLLIVYPPAVWIGSWLGSRAQRSVPAGA
ncbi:MAG: hypothetical protein LAP38_15850 [Acidobacteriia bacterium]|nr:hypothetical protein [Terriglobia bacterium]